MSQRSPDPSDGVDDRSESPDGRSDGVEDRFHDEDGPPVAPTDRKALLFCQACDHASPVDGDWVVVVGPDETVVYRCPACGNELERRPSFGEDPRTRATACD